MLAGLTGWAEICDVFVWFGALHRGCDFPPTPAAVFLRPSVDVELKTSASRPRRCRQCQIAIGDCEKSKSVEDFPDLDFAYWHPGRCPSEIKGLADQDVVCALNAVAVAKGFGNFALRVCGQARYDGLRFKTRGQEVVWTQWTSGLGH
jgi:hypothetical protein